MLFANSPLPTTRPSGADFWQTAFLFLLPIIRERAFLPVFAKMTTDTELPARHRRKPFSTLCNTENPKMATGQTENFPVHSKHHRLACFCQKLGAKKCSKSFSRLTASCTAVGRRVIQFWDWLGRQHSSLSPLVYSPAKTDGAVNGGRSSFILIVDWLGWIYFPL